MGSNVLNRNNWEIFALSEVTLPDKSGVCGTNHSVIQLSASSSNAIKKDHNEQEYNFLEIC